MPCQDYENDDIATINQLRSQNDRLARIACKAMTELEKQGRATFLILSDSELREWWEKHKITDQKRQVGTW